MNRHILLVDDDRVLSDLLRQYFEGEGYSVSQVFDGQNAVTRASEQSFDVIVLDVMMPVMDGFETLRALRKVNDTPVIMLTARGEDIDRIIGLEMGADDYLAKPCNPRELLARIKAILRRTDWSGRKSSTDDSSLEFGRLKLEPANREARVNGEEFNLTSTEYSVLETLMRYQGKLVSKDTLSQYALGRKLGQHDRSVDMHISHLRKKLDRAHCGITIKTIRGHGFRLSPNTHYNDQNKNQNA
jgi:two-component system response regulator CpxR